MASYVLGKVGRKSSLVITQFAQSASVFLTGITTLYESNVLAIISVLLYSIAYNLGIGTIVWPYCAEVMHRKAMSIAIGV